MAIWADGLADKPNSRTTKSTASATVRRFARSPSRNLTGAFIREPNQYDNKYGCPEFRHSHSDKLRNWKWAKGLTTRAFVIAHEIWCGLIKKVCFLISRV
jgi:hypothetical protein